MTTILVVDDSLTERRLAVGILKQGTSWTVLEADSGEEALGQLELNHPDVVLTDLIMPHMSGLDVVRAVGQASPLVPVILMTAQGNEEIAVEALQNGAAGYVPKKNLAKELVPTLEHVLSALHEDRAHTRLIAHRMTRTESSFVLENDPSLFGPLVDYLRQIMAEMHLGDKMERLRTGVAVEEALSNAYFHGNLEIGRDVSEPDPQLFGQLANERIQKPEFNDRRIYVDAAMSQQEAVFVVRDEGTGFDVSQLPPPDEPMSFDQPGGRGAVIMQTLMDDVSYNNVGNQVTLIKHFDLQETDPEPVE